MYENLLPLGSVVQVEGTHRRLMITGRIQARVGERKVYDYSACWYPEGIVNARQMLFFDHDAIERLFFIGYQDDEELAFRTSCLAGLGELDVDEKGTIFQRDVPREVVPSPTGADGNGTGRD